MYILGISCYYHDSAAVILKDGILIAASEEERFSRVKHDSSFPKLSIEFCLKKAGITSNDLSYVVFYEKPFLKFERIFLTSLSYVPKSFNFFRESMKQWFFDKLWIKNHIISNLNIPENKLLFSEHHLSHMASSFYCSPYKKSALLSIDAVGEWTTMSWGIGKENKIEIKEEIKFPNSLGLLYSAFTVFAGFEANDGEYKLMGLAPYGKPKYTDKIRKLIRYNSATGGFSANLEYFSYQYDPKGVYTKKFEELFGQKNINPDAVITYYADIAASIQIVLEEILLDVCSYVYKKTAMKALCYAGGVALNSKANWRILTESKFNSLYIQPAAGDSGGALGAALWVYHNVLNFPKNFVMEHVYYGAKESDNSAELFLKSKKIKYRKVRSKEKLIDEISDKIVKGNVIGWVQDEFEWGPRALGHRSILADPRSIDMKNLVNSKIKFREAFRPFAPSAIYEKADSFFEIKNLKSELPFNFMLYVVPVKENKRENLGAITHVDGTARPQFVHNEINPLYHSLIAAFGQKTDTSVILNTSFNLKGEPIVNTVKDALKTFKASGIDSLVIGDIVIEKNKI